MSRNTIKLDSTLNIVLCWGVLCTGQCCCVRLPITNWCAAAGSQHIISMTDSTLFANPQCESTRICLMKFRQNYSVTRETNIFRISIRSYDYCTLPARHPVDKIRRYLRHTCSTSQRNLFSDQMAWLYYILGQFYFIPINILSQNFSLRKSVYLTNPFALPVMPEPLLLHL